MQKDPRKFSTQDAMELASSPAGQQLMALLQRSDSPQLRTAMQEASNGNFTQAQKMLGPLLASPEVQKLLQQLGGK